MNSPKEKDFFVSYNRNDQDIAEWIAATLEAEGYSTIIQAWDFRPGGNFVLDMHRAASNTKRTIAVLSPNYLKAEYTQPEWAAAFVQDPTGKDRILIPVRVEACELTGLLRAIVYVDFVGVSEAEAKKRLLQGVSETGPVRFVSVSFPRLEVPSNLPRVSEVFVGREQALQELHDQWKPGELIAISSIKGMGGIGKTELALQYALKHLKARDFPGGVCWLRAREDIGLQVVQFAREKLGLIAPDDLELGQQVEWCWKNWQKAATLIIFDDVQAYENIEPFLPPQREQFRVLLTTRRYLTGSVKNYEIKVLSEAASLEFLRRLVPDGRIDQDLPGAKQLCEWLGYLPLGLELVGRYLARRKGTSIAKLWQRLQEQRLAAKALLEAEPGMTASLGVAAAFELSWQELTADAQQLAAFLSLFALAEIPWSIVQQCLPESDEEALEDLRDEQLVNLSLLSFERDGMYKLHQLLREFFAVKRSQMPEDEAMKRLFCLVMVSISTQMPTAWTLQAIAQFSPVIPHLKEATTILEPCLADEDIYKLATRLGQFYAGQSAFEEAEEWYVHCRSITIQRLGESHPDVVMSLNNLALLYESQGRYEEAEPLLQQALELNCTLLGEGHPHVAGSLNSLALLYESQGRYEEAEPLLQQALKLRRTLLGDAHPNVAKTLNNLAALYYSQGRYEEAEPLYQQALELNCTLLGESHPDVAMSLNNLALLYESQGRYEEAEPLLQQALELNCTLLGEGHPHVAGSLNSLALLYESQGRYEEAEPLYQKALEQYHTLLGDAHPNVAKTLNNLAALYESQGRYEDAEQQYEKALKISDLSLGAAHPTSMRIRQNYATCLKRIAMVPRIFPSLPEKHS